MAYSSFDIYEVYDLIDYDSHFQGEILFHQLYKLLAPHAYYINYA